VTSVIGVERPVSRLLFSRLAGKGGLRVIRYLGCIVVLKKRSCTIVNACLKKIN
jgi:hypothetical protein